MYCDQCDDIARDGDRLRKHRRKHNKKQNKCRYAGDYTTELDKSLKGHIQAKNPNEMSEEKLKRLSCYQCEFIAKRLVELDKTQSENTPGEISMRDMWSNISKYR